MKTHISKFKIKNILQLSSLFVLLSTSVIAEVIPIMDGEAKAVLIKVEHGKDLQFRATAEDWKEIRSHMLPARIDPKPAFWEGLADATIIKKNGKSLKVDDVDASKWSRRIFRRREILSRRQQLEDQKRS